MSDKETKERIEKEADDYADQIYNRKDYRLNWQNRRNGYVRGAELERPKAWNEAIDEAIQICNKHAHITEWLQLKGKLESLKHKQP